ncbi:hypothetical protein [Colwellia sp. MEBiC06753]
MTKLIQIITLISLLIYFPTSAEGHSNNTKVETIIKDFIIDLKAIQLKDNQLYLNLINSKYKSSYLVDITSEEKEKLDIDFANALYEVISNINSISFLKTEVFEGVACSFVTDGKMFLLFH